MIPAQPRLPEYDEFSAVIFRTDFTDEAAWTRVVTEVKLSAVDDADPERSYTVVDVPLLGGADSETVPAVLAAWRKGWEPPAVVFIADSTTMSSALFPLLAVTTLTREDALDDEEYEETVEHGPAFRTLPREIHAIHANVEGANTGFQDFSSAAHEAPDGVYRSCGEDD
ncbi:hypothetical protein Q8791_02940 [Nocardiopsis sp. CT-R113]|uniref:DUF6924 domain-containing protein n=1 Tax=Nocardiopsis codii TaxID=3065942 RepID=A0ABU7K1Q2_9ACTN|nr:hypothetical protein [Nocardiopsis sp. CT-R113]MEE2036176.1 hypothetical protein [Nocardiopsis sp. CT-R113]